MIKCYIITAVGKVQDIGFRTRVENIGRGYDLRGQVQNEKDGSVKTMCGGKDKDVDDFVRVIRRMIGKNDTVTSGIKEEELPLDRYYDFPYPFGKVHTDDDEDLGRKLDKGNDLLADIKEDTSILPEMDDTLKSMNDTLKSMNDILKKIAEK